MPEIALHHYPLSPFSEKIRLALGLKGLEYKSVTIPPMMPKPDLIPLTGGYRRTPIIQVGADIYCDTLLILREIERRHPATSLYPDGKEGEINALCWWFEKNMFAPAVFLVFILMGEHFPKEFIEERKPFGFDLEPSKIKPHRGLYEQRLQAHLAWLTQMLASGQKFIMGAHPSAADLAAYHIMWFMTQNGGPEIPKILPLKPLQGWYDRVAALGHGKPKDFSSADALALAQGATPISPDTSGSVPGFKFGDKVSVTPDDTGRDPVSGVLVGASEHEVVVQRSDPKVGQINVHFPRAGFEVIPG